MAYDLDKIRAKMKEKGRGHFQDPDEFRPPSAKPGEKITYRFFILPPLSKGEKCAGGVASQDMDLYYVQNGNHWVQKKPYPCPRVHDGEECDVCNIGFERMNETQDKKEKSTIARNYLPQVRNAMNIYFLSSDSNPEELRGKNKWFNAPKQVIDICDACLNRDDAGDPEDPQAYGVFFNEQAAYVFQLEITKQGDYNEYKASKFLASVGPTPIAAKKEGNQRVPLTEKIQEILNGRFDLYTKFDPRDKKKIAELAQKLLAGNSSEQGNGFDQDENRGGKGSNAQTVSEDSLDTVAGEGAAPAGKAPAPKAAKPAAAASKPAAPVAAPVVDVDGGDGDDIENLLNSIKEDDAG
jgi:hypothetical protein